MTHKICRWNSIISTDKLNIRHSIPTNHLLHFSNYYPGYEGLNQDWGRAVELYARAAARGRVRLILSSVSTYYDRGNLKKAKFHYKAAAMAGHEDARSNLGTMEAQSGNMGQAVKHWVIAASAGEYNAMHNLLIAFNQVSTSRATIDSSLRAYNKSCIEMRSEARDAAICLYRDNIGAR